MRTTRRQALGFIGVGLASAVLAACSSTSPAATPAAVAAGAATATAAPANAAAAAPTPVPTPAQSTLAAKSGKATIDIWHTYGSGPGRTVILNMFKEFSDSTGIGINESYNSSCCDARIQQKFTAAVAAGTPPDVYDTTSPIVLGGQGALLPLDDLMKRDNFVLNTTDWYPNPVFYAQWQGKTYGLPYDTDSRGMFWNKAHFKEAGLDPEKPPKTWSELQDFATKLTKKDGDKITRVGFSPLYGESWNWAYIGQAGGYPYLDLEQKPAKARFDTPEAIKAFEYMLTLTDLSGGMTQLSSFQQGFQTGVSQPFLSGQVSIMYHGSWYPDQITQYKPDMKYGVDYGITDQCIADEGGKLFCMTGGWFYSIPKGVKHQDEAWQWVHWFDLDPQLLQWNRDTSHIPTKLSVGKDPSFSKMPINFFVNAMRYAHGWPGGPWTEQPKYTMSNAQDDILYKKRTAKDALTEANSDQQKVIDDYYKSGQ